MKKKFISGVLLAAIVSVAAFAVNGDIGGNKDGTPISELNTESISIANDQIAVDSDISEAILDSNVREEIARQINSDGEIMASDIQGYLAKNNGVLKLSLDNTAVKLDGLGSLKNIEALRIENATNTNFDWDELQKMSELKSLTIVNSTLSPSDIASYVGHIVRQGHLQYLYINAAIPGKSGTKFKQIEETAQGLSGAYTTALNDLGDRTTSKNQLKILSLVGNNWQGNIASFTKLKESGCQIALDSNAHAIMTTDYEQTNINLIN